MFKVCRFTISNGADFSALSASLLPCKSGSSTGATGARPLFELFLGLVFVNFDCITRIYFNSIHHTMFIICTLFFTFTTKHRVCVKGASKQKSQNPRILPRRYRPLPLPPRIFKFLDPPLPCIPIWLEIQQKLTILP